MKRLFVLLSVMFLLVALTACGGKEVSDKEINNVESSEKDSGDNENKDSEKQEDDGNESKEFNQEIVDNDNVKATLISVKKIVDKTFNEEKVQVIFEVENKRDDTIIAQAREVSADGKMISESMLTMSQEVSSGKRADAILTIQNYDGDLPSMEEDIEMILHIFSWDDMNFREDHKVKIDFK